MKPRFCAVVAMLLMTAAIHADTLVLTSGRRVQGQLVGIVDGQIEFEEQGLFRPRTLVIARQDIARIEFGPDHYSASQQPAAAVPPPGVPRGMRERLLDVQANQRWNDTGVDIREGQQLYFAASGETRWGPRNRKDGAAGERNSPVDSIRPIPDRPAAALIGKIGDGQDIFFIGGEMGPFRARQSGRLYLGINDGWLEDNSGALRVKVSY